jgi:hypothetical protein
MDSAINPRLCHDPQALCTVRVIGQEFALEDAIGSHACSLDAIMNSVTRC